MEELPASREDGFRRRVGGLGRRREDGEESNDDGHKDEFVEEAGDGL